MNATGTIGWAILIPIVAGVFSLIGAWLGSYLSRRADSDKWLRQSRTEAFVEFLRIMNECEDNYYRSLRSDDFSKGSNSETFIKIQDIYQPAFNEARITRLFLESKVRDELRDMLMTLIDSISEERGLDETKRAKESIQMLLENHLS